MRSPTPRATPVVVLGLSAALLIAAGSGGAVAGALVTSKQIKNNTILGKDVRDGGLTGADMADGSVGGADLGDGTVTGADVADGSLSGSDVADGSLGAADLAPGTGRQLGGLVASGAVDFSGGVSKVRTAAGVDVTVARLDQGFYCLQVSGVDVSSTVMTASPQISSNATAGVTTSLDVVLDNAACENGFTVITYRRSSGGVTESDTGFVFQIG